MKYGYVIDKKIIKIGQCPKNTNKTSNFDKLPDSAKIKQGWYPVKEGTIELKEYETKEVSYTLDKLNIIESCKKVSMSLEDYKKIKLDVVRNNTSLAILNEAPEYKQRNVALGIYDEEESFEIKESIEFYRNKCHEIETLIEKATTLDAVSKININIIDLEDTE